MHTFFHGPCAAADSHLIDECVRRVTGPRQSFIYVVPTARRTRSLEKRVLHKCTGGFFRPRLFTFHTLTDFLYRKLGGTGVPISQSVKAMLIEEIVSDSSLELSYFSRENDRPFPGLVTRLAGFISDLKQNVITPEEFKTRAASGNWLDQKNTELAVIYSHYQLLLERHGLIDTDGMFWLVGNRLQEPDAALQALSGIDLLVFDGFFDVTTAESKVLDVLLDKVENVWLRLDWTDGDTAHVAARPFVERFCKQAKAVQVAPPNIAPAAILPSLLFDHEASPPAGKLPADEVEIIPCRDRRSEIETIAVRIKQLVNGGTSPNAIAVAFKDMQGYAPLVRQMFGEAGIQFNCPCGRPLVESPVVATLASVLEVIRENYSRASVVKLLRSPYVRFTFSDDTLDGDLLDMQAREARIFRGRDSWRQKLEAYAEELAVEAKERDDDRFDHTKAMAAIADLKRQAVGVSEVLDLIARLDAAMAPKPFRSIYSEIISRLGIAQNIYVKHETNADIEVIERDYRALRAFQKVLDGLVFAASYSDRETFTFTEYADMIAAGLGSETFDIRREVDHGVQVLPVDEVRGGDYDIVFLGGMVDGEFPRPETPRIFYSEQRRRLLGIKCDPANLDIERYLFAGVVAAPRRRLHVSYPRSDGGRMLLKSLFVSELERLGVPVAAEPPSCEAAEIVSNRRLHRHLGGALGGRHFMLAETALELCRTLPGDASLRDMLRCLAIEERRRKGEGFSEYEGMLTDDGVKQQIAERYHGDRTFSVSKLEMYAKCPFRFFAVEVARLTELEEPEEEMDALDRGSILHHIVGRFYMERRAAGSTPLGRDSNRAEALAHIISIAEDELSRMPFEGMFWEIERERILGGPGRRTPGLIEQFIDTEMSSTALCTPQFFEVSFGRSHRDEMTDQNLRFADVVIEDADRVKIAGRIDRIDIDPESKSAIVYDYKSGKAPEYSDIMNGYSLQVPIYLMALQGWEYRTIGAGYYQLRDGDFGRTGFLGNGVELKSLAGIGYRKNGMLSEDELDGFLATTRQRISTYARRIRAGEFPPTALPERQAGCTYCPAKSVCRRNENKVHFAIEEEDADA